MKESEILLILIVSLIDLRLVSSSSPLLNSFDQINKTLTCTAAPQLPSVNSIETCPPNAEFFARLAEFSGSKTGVLTMEQILNLDGIGIRRWIVPVDERNAVLYRLTDNPIDGKPNSKTPTLLLHGLLANACTYAFINAKKNGCGSITYSLFKAGLDVFLMDNPGTINSTGSTQPPIGALYWDFSWDDVADIYLSPVINKIIDISGQPMINVVGHSMGTTVTIAALSTHDDLRPKIKNVVLIAPVFHFKHYSFLLNLLAITKNIFTILLDLDPNILAVPVPTKDLVNFLRTYGGGYCNSNGVSTDICEFITGVLMGCSYKETVAERLGALIRCVPDVATLKMLVHYAQCISAKQFQKFDYGPTWNMIKYGQCSPPVYDVSRVQTSIYTISGTADVLSPPGDNLAMNEALGDNLKGTLVLTNYNHIDYMVGQSACSCVDNYIKSVFEVGQFDQTACTDGTVTKY